MYYYLSLPRLDVQNSLKTTAPPNTLMARRKTSINFDEDLWKEVKKHCIDLDLEVSEYIEQLVRKNLRR